MRLGIAFHVFSGLEFLKPAILNLRSKAFCTIGVYSAVSYMGHPAPSYMMYLLDDLIREGLLSEIIRYDPKITDVPIEMADNHRAKREMGRIRCLKLGCTHFMSRDCDEFYNLAQFEKQLDTFGQHDFTGAPTIEYIKSPSTRLLMPSCYHIPVVHDVHLRYAPFRHEKLFDLSRTVAPVKNAKIFASDELLVHHMNHTRISERELRRKWEGHSCYKQYNADKYAHDILNYPQELLTNVPDQFGIISYWESEFKKRFLSE
jgi:hypothetical protein